jgi:tRNA 5-methylaminomethyl-2-thiouridine biosynthesis bifunctional protein
LPKFKTCSYDLVFLDGFSPSKQPELWSEKVFSYIYKILKPNGKILTYTRSNIVRRNMSSSGLVVYDIFDENNNVVGTVGKKVI